MTENQTATDFGELAAADDLETELRRRQRRHRWLIYTALILCSLWTTTFRLFMTSGESYGESVPYFSANDRSRWATIRSLGDHDTFALDLILQAENGERWDTIDKVVHLGRDGKPHTYSSKPTLLPWLLAYKYLAIKQVTGKNLEEDTFFVVRCMLLLTQILPLGLFLFLMAKLAEEMGCTEWSKIVVVACASFGTFLTTFSITLTNHIPATISAGIALLCLIAIWRRGKRHWGYFALAGLFSAFAAANDLPALSLVAVAFGLCFLKSPIKTFLAFLPPVGVIVAAALGTNYLAHQELTPPYAHRNDGPPIAEVMEPTDANFTELLDQAIIPTPLLDAIIAHGNQLGARIQEDSIIRRGSWPCPSYLNRWLLDNPDHSSRIVIVNNTAENPREFTLHRWYNWYEYPRSYWSADNPYKSAVDRGERSLATYALHFLVGHHGVFSLSPIWIWAIPGLLMMVFNSKYQMRLPALAFLAMSVVVIVFYLMRPPIDRAYGGLSSGPRWLFWLIPFWLVGLIPFLDAIRNWPAMKTLVLVTLLISAGSAAYAWSNPWVHPWIFTVFGFSG